MPHQDGKNEKGTQQSQACTAMPVILATKKDEAGESKVRGQPGQLRPCLKKKKKSRQ
jgi:hypothetical protein